MFADLFTSRGRRSVPPSVVAMVLQRLDGLSDQEAVDRYAFDVRWRYAAGVGGYGGVGWARFAHTVLVDMRERLRVSAARTGCSRWRWVRRGHYGRVMSQQTDDAAQRDKAADLEDRYVAEYALTDELLEGLNPDLPGGQQTTDAVEAVGDDTDDHVEKMARDDP